MVVRLSDDRAIRRQERSEERGFLYERVVEIVERLIESEHLQPGDKLPTQAELSEMAGVSRITVTRALDMLERRGRIRRHQGLGTFVAGARLLSDPARVGGFLSTLDVQIGRLDTALLSLEVGRASPDLRAALAIDRTEPVWRLRRLRSADDRPIILETSVIPTRLAPDLQTHRSQLADSLYDLLERAYGLRDTSEQQILDVVAPDPEERRLLRLRASDVVVRIRGLSMQPNGEPFDSFEQLYPAADFAFSISTGGLREVFVEPRQGDWFVEPQAQGRSGDKAQGTGGRRSSAKREGEAASGNDRG